MGPVAAPRALAASAVVLLGLGVSATIAEASFPGGHGRVFFDSDRDGDREIFSMGPVGEDARQLTANSASDAEPAISAYGHRVVFTTDREGAGESAEEIYAMDPDGSDQIGLTTNAASDSQPAFSPLANKIAFTSMRDGNAEIYVMDADGTDQVRLTNNPAADEHPSFSPDGQQIVFSSTRDGDREIFVMDADGDNPMPLTANTEVDSDPDYAPDGQRIAFESQRDGNAEIYVMDADGTDQVRLTNHAAVDSEPAFAPSGAYIAFSRDGQIHSIRIESAGLQRLTFSSANDENPNWAPIPVGGSSHLVLVLDDSGSIDSAEFSQLKDSMLNLVNSLGDHQFFATGGGSVGVVQFGTTARTSVALSGSRAGVVNGIQGLSQQGGSTCIGCGIDQATALLDGTPSDERRFAIVLTDGANNVGTPDAASHLAASIASSDAASINRLAVGIDGYVAAQLNQIATDPDSEHVFAATAFSQASGLTRAIVWALINFDLADADADAIPDIGDNCAATSNVDQANSDGDPDGDACDPDDDNDEIPDDADNCPTDPNPAQENQDADPRGDACDSDDDNDTVDDVTDACDMLSATTGSGCPAATGTLTLKYSPRKERFRGALASGEASCTAAREIRVYKQVAGRDRRKGMAITNANGAYRLDKRARAGKYYARASKAVVADVAECAAGKSPKVTVR